MIEIISVTMLLTISVLLTLYSATTNNMKLVHWAARPASPLSSLYQM